MKLVIYIVKVLSFENFPFRPSERFQFWKFAFRPSQRFWILRFCFKPRQRFSISNFGIRYRKRFFHFQFSLSALVNVFNFPIFFLDLVKLYVNVFDKNRGYESGGLNDRRNFQIVSGLFQIILLEISRDIEISIEISREIEISIINFCLKSVSNRFCFIIWIGNVRYDNTSFFWCQGVYA